jgi:pilus assembly protein CpaF
MMIVTISEKGGQQSQYDFGAAAITIGRMKGNDIVLPKGNVSKKHSRISIIDGSLFISDMNSTNGTYVNGRKVAGEQPITENDKIYIGDFILQVQATQSAGQPAAGQPAAGQPPAAPPAPPANGSKPPAPPAAPDLGHSSGLAGSVDDLFTTGESPQAPRNRRPKNTIPESAMDFDGPGPGRDPHSSQNLGGDPVDSRGPAAPSRHGSGPADAAPPRRHAESSSAESAPVALRDSGAHGSSDAAHSADPAPAGLGSDNAFSSGSEPMSPPREGSPSGPLGGDSAQRSSRRPLPTPREVRSEFDPEFHAAQHDVARVLFEKVSPQDLALEYPPQAAELEKYEEMVSEAVDVVSPSVDRDFLVELITTECVGLGPIDLYLDDAEVQDIYIQQFDRILIRRNGELVVAERAFSHPDFLTLAANRLLGTRDGAILTDELRFGDGTRIHLVMPPIAVDGPAITIRKPPVAHLTMDDLVARNVLSTGMREFLERAVQAGRSILIAGPTSSGKTTLLGAVAELIAPGTRVITVEESTHLELPQASVVRLEANPQAGYDLKSLVRTAVAMHPQRILLDECRGDEAYEWVSSAASGTEGSMATAHGISAAAALERIESLCLLGNPEISPRGLREQIARAVDFLVVLNRSDDHGFRVRQISELQGVDLDAFRLNDVFYHRVEGNEEQFHPTGFIPLFYEDLRHAGIDVDFDIFRD